MSRIVTLGPARQDLFLIDRDDFIGAKMDEQSIFSKITIGSKIDIDKTLSTVGGSAANASVTFARYGHEVIYIGNLARDVAGDAVVSCFDDENIDTSYINFLRGATSSSVILLDVKSCAATTLECRGVSAKTSNLDPNDLETIQPDWLYATSLNGDMEKLLEFFEKAHELDAKVMWNPGVAELKQVKKVLGLLDEVDVLLLNKPEAAQLVPGTILVELLSHLKSYCKTVLITDGIMGAIATMDGEAYRLGVYEQGRLLDKTGAGDAFGAGFLAEYAEHEDFATALRYAAANAAKVTQHYGATAGILTGPEDFHPMPLVKVEEFC